MSVARGAGAALVLLLAASCAPRLAVPPRLDVEERLGRHRAALAERRDRAAFVAASLVLWAERGERRLPGAQADLFLAAPRGVRLRVASSFGTAFDLGMAGDSLTAYVPAWRRGLALAAAADSLGLRSPAERLVRALSATWDPPHEAWRGAAWSDSLLRLAWVEDGDSVAVLLGAAGLPRRARLWRPGEIALRADYVAWDRGSGTAWPTQVELEDELRDLRVVARASQLRFRERPDREHLAVRLPPGAEPLSLAELRAVLDRLGIP